MPWQGRAPKPYNETGDCLSSLKYICLDLDVQNQTGSFGWPFLFNFLEEVAGEGKSLNDLAAAG